MRSWGRLLLALQPGRLSACGPRLIACVLRIMLSKSAGCSSLGTLGGSVQGSGWDLTRQAPLSP